MRTRKHSNSSISTYFRCPREYKHKYVDKRTPLDDYSPEAEFGVAFHNHLEKGTWPERDGWRNIRMHVLLTGYRHIYSGELGQQREIEWEYDDEHGIFDGVSPGYLIEDKTTKSTIGEFYWNRKVLDSQVSLYLWAANKLGMDVDHMKYRVTRHAPKKPLNNETYDEYEERYTNHVKRYQSGIFVSEVFRRSEQELAAFEQSRAMAKHLVSHSIASGNFPQATNSCFQFNRFCGYLPVCMGKTTIDDDSLYQIRKRRK